MLGLRLDVFAPDQINLELVLQMNVNCCVKAPLEIFFVEFT